MIDEFSGLSRRGLLGAGAAAAIGAALSGAFPKSIAAQGETTDDLVFVNGRIHTMDGKNTIAGSVSIRNGRFSAVDAAAPPPRPGTRVIDLRGRTVVRTIIGRSGSAPTTSRGVRSQGRSSSSSNGRVHEEGAVRHLLQKEANARLWSATSTWRAARDALLPVGKFNGFNAYDVSACTAPTRGPFVTATRKRSIHIARHVDSPGTRGARSS